MTRNRIYLIAPVLLTSIVAAVLAILPGLALASSGSFAGCLFGLAVAPGGSGIYFVDDCDNTLKLLA